MPTRKFHLVRSGTAAPDIQAAEARSGPVGAAISSAGRTTFLATKDDAGITTWVVVPDSDRTGQVVSAVGAATAARAIPDDSLGPDALSSDEVGWLVARPRSVASRATQHGGEQSELAMLLSRILRPGEWVAITLRSPTNTEIRNVRRWFDYRLDPVTHYSKDGGLVVGSLFAGAETREQVSNLLSQVASAIPGFDVETTVKYPPRPVPPTAVLVCALAAAIGTGIRTHRLVLGLLVGAAALVAGVIAAVFPTAARVTGRRLRQAAGDPDQLPAPARRRLPPRRPVRKDVVRMVDGQPQRRHIEHSGDYPLDPRSFILRPAMILGIVSPHAGVDSGASESRSRTVPAALLADIGPIVSRTPQPVHIDAAELYGGVFISGIPGSGKTSLIHHLWAWHVLERVRPTGIPGRPGRDNAIIAFESKGEGAALYRRWSDAFGDRVVEVSLADTSTPAIDMVTPSIPAPEQARVIVSAMTEAFGHGAIQDASSKALTVAITAGLLCPDDVARSVLPDGPISFMRVAHVLLTGEGDQRSVAMFTRLTDWANGAGADTSTAGLLADTLARMDYIHGPGVREAARRSAVSAPENKLDLLMQAPHWWSGVRRRAPWSQVLANHSSVIVNAGVDRAGRQLDESVSTVLMAMSAYALRDAIQRHCSGWRDAGRSVTVFADELALLAKSSADVIEWLRDTGRSYGVRLILATQRPEQIPASLRGALRNFATTIWFRQSDPIVVAEITTLLGMDGSVWDANDLVALAPFQAVLRATADARMQPPVPISTAWWGDILSDPTVPERFAQDHGWRIGTPIGQLSPANPSGQANQTNPPSRPSPANPSNQTSPGEPDATAW
jgi:hypothetical protein